MSLQNRYLNPMFGCGHEATGFTGLVTTGPIGVTMFISIIHASLSLQLSEFQCEDGKKCIQKYQKCNHRNECEDQSDEKDCSK